MLSNYEMSSVCVDVGVMWRLSEDLNRRFAARVQHHHPHHHVHGHRTSSMLYNGITFFNICHIREKKKQKKKRNIKRIQ